jgi:FixJ family two-component response regulator
MIFIPSVQYIADHLLESVGWGSVITFFGSLAWFLLKTKAKASDFISKVSSEWSEAREDIKEAKAKLETATTNHLTHIEAATSTTAALMERQNGILERIVDANTQNSVALAKTLTLLQVFTSK